MRVFVTGASGFVGSAVVQELLAHGHEVLGLARSDAGAASVQALGARVLRGALEDLDSLREGASACDGVIHTAFDHDFSKFVEGCDKDRRAIEALGEPLAGTAKPLLVTSGLAVLARDRLATEDDVPLPAGAAMPRVSEATAAALAARGVHASTVRLPPSVHGDGDHGFVPVLIGIARDQGRAGYIGAGANLWGGVHRLDAARVFRLALERGARGARYHAVADEGIPFRDIAAVIARLLDMPLASLAPEDAAAYFGWFTRFAGMQLAASSGQTRALLGWQPRERALLEDLEHGRYF